MANKTPELSSCASFEEGLASRRNALRVGMGIMALGGLSTVFGDAFMETTYAASGTADEILVVLSLRGAADGLSLVVPHGDSVYYQARPSIGVPKANLWGGDAYFGLHPALSPLKPLWDAGKMAAVHSAGQPVSSRSHFVAMEEVEDSDPGSSARIGWLNRLVGLRSEQHMLQAMQWGSNLPNTQVMGPAQFTSAGDIGSLSVGGAFDAYEQPRYESLNGLFANAPGPIGANGITAIQLGRDFKAIGDAPAGLKYPNGDLGSALASAARTIKANKGAEVITVDQGSWDHHTWVGNLDDGNIKRMATDLGACLATFFEDLGPYASKVTLVTISEFGRRVKENANQGLDHGDGTVMFLLGDKVRGGYHGRWAGLQNTFDAGVQVTTDYRSVLAEVISVLYPTRDLSAVFPGFTRAQLGVMKSVPVVPPVKDPEPPVKPPVTPPPPPKPPVVVKPAILVKYWKHSAGTPKWKRYMTPPRPVLSTAGKGAKVTYVWYLSGKRISTTSKNKYVYKTYRGRTLKVVVTVSKRGGKTESRTKSWKISKS